MGAKSLYLRVGLVSMIALAWAPQAQAKDLRVYYYGDSIAFESFRSFQQAINQKVNWTVVNRSYPGTSPCDWFQSLESDMARGDAKAVILESYGNNMSKCQIRKNGRAPSDSPSYWRRYRQDLGWFMDRIPGKIPVWMTPPAASSMDLMSGISHKARMLATMQQVAKDYPNLKVFDAATLIDRPGRRYASSAPCLAAEPCSNVPRKGYNRLHSGDGLHYCPSMPYATVAWLANCPSYSSGAWRFGNTQVSTILGGLGIQ